MTEIGNILKEARESRKMSIDELSRLSKIRPYILEAIEEGNLSVQPEVYVKAFVKTISGILKIENDEINNFLNPPQSSKSKKHAESLHHSDKEETPAQHYAKLFKKNVTKKNRKKEYILYSVIGSIGIIVLLAAYLIFFNSDSKSTVKAMPDSSSPSDVLVVQKNDKKNLLSYFQNNDSLVLKAVAMDTVWMRIEIDGKTSEEILMKPGMEMQWSANDHFIIDQGNAGGIKFYRNGTELQPFGTRGTVVKNIKITRNEVLNDNPWKTDSIRKANQTRSAKKKKEEKDSRPRLIEPSGVDNINPLTNKKLD